MKKVISLFCIVAFLLCAGCSKEPTEKEISNYIGDGMMTNFKLLFSNNEYFVNEVFINSRLPIDETQTVSENGKTYAKVISDKFENYSALEASVKATYALSAAEKLLNEKNFYCDINGSLYFDMSFDFEKTDGPVWNIEKAKSVSVKKEKYVFKIPCKADQKSTSSEFTIILDNNEWRLEEVYTK